MIVEFVREKYLNFLNNSIVLMIVQNSRTTNPLNNNLTASANYAVYMLVESWPLPSEIANSSSWTTRPWTIYKIWVEVSEVMAGNFKVAIKSLVEFAKNGQLSSHIISSGLANKTDSI